MLPTDSFDEMDAPHIPPSFLQQQLASYRVPPGHREEIKPPRDILVKLSMTETDFVVVEDTRQLSSNAVVLKVSSVCAWEGGWIVCAWGVGGLDCVCVRVWGGVGLCVCAWGGLDCVCVRGGGWIVCVCVCVRGGGGWIVCGMPFVSGKAETNNLLYFLYTIPRVTGIEFCGSNFNDFRFMTG